MQEHQGDVEADFLVFYRIENPWVLPLDRFMSLSRRLFYYQGALQARAMEEQESRDQDSHQYHVKGTPDLNGHGVDMRHNMAAAKAAARGLKEGDDEVKVIPASMWMAQFPGLGEQTTGS